MLAPSMNRVIHSWQYKIQTYIFSPLFPLIMAFSVTQKDKQKEKEKNVVNDTMD